MVFAPRRFLVWRNVITSSLPEQLVDVFANRFDTSHELGSTQGAIPDSIPLLKQQLLLFQERFA
jgi:hypothetical protein